MSSNPAPSEAHVLKLVEAALESMNDIMDDSYTSTELFSAVLTLMSRVIQVLLARGADEAGIRSAVEKIFLQRSAASGKLFDPRMN